MKKNPRIIVLGAGISGLMAARTLVDAGLTNVTVFDKGRSVGGRLATRRVGNAKIDHGIPNFTVHTPEFQQYVSQWQTNDWVKLVNERDYIANGGMNALAKHLAEGLDVALNCRAVNIAPSETGAGFTVSWKNDVTISEGMEQVDALIVAMPLPQAFELVRYVAIPEATKQILATTMYHSQLVGLFVLDQPSAIPNMWVLNDNPQLPFTFVVDHYQKGMSDTYALTMIGKENWSKENYDRPEADVLTVMIQTLHPWLGEAKIIAQQLKRWKYGQAATHYPLPFLIGSETPSLLFAGDVFTTIDPTIPRAGMDHALRSGVASANHLLATFKQLQNS